MKRENENQKQQMLLISLWYSVCFFAAYAAFQELFIYLLFQSLKVDGDQCDSLDGETEKKIPLKTQDKWDETECIEVRLPNLDSDARS